MDLKRASHAVALLCSVLQCILKLRFTNQYFDDCALVYVFGSKITQSCLQVFFTKCDEIFSTFLLLLEIFLYS